jgi:hypothetical protein
MENKFKKGDLVQMDNQFSPDRHPPMGTLGIVIDVEDWDEPVIDGNDTVGVTVDVDQFVRVHWAHHKNTGDQCYIDASLKKVSEA